MSRRRASGPAVRVTYDPEADALYKEFRDGVAADNVDLAPSVTAGLDRRGACSGSRSSTPRGTCGRSSPALRLTRAGWAATTEIGEFRRLWALLAARAKRAGITPKDVDREITAHRACRR